MILKQKEMTMNNFKNIFFDTRYRDSNTKSYDSNFSSVNFLEKSDTHMSILNITLPRFNVINSKINKFTLYEDFDSFITELEIPVGNYSLNELLTTIQYLCIRQSFINHSGNESLSYKYSFTQTNPLSGFILFQIQSYQDDTPLNNGNILCRIQFNSVKLNDMLGLTDSRFNKGITLPLNTMRFISLNNPDNYKSSATYISNLNYNSTIHLACNLVTGNNYLSGTNQISNYYTSYDLSNFQFSSFSTYIDLRIENSIAKIRTGQNNIRWTFYDSYFDILDSIENLPIMIKCIFYSWL